MNRSDKNIIQFNESIFKSIFNSAGIAVCLVDLKGNLVLFNNALLNLTGYNAEEITKLQINDLSYPEDIKSDRKLIVELIRGKRKSYSINKRYLTKSGDIIWGDLIASIIKDENGNPQYGVGIIQDITEQKQKEARFEFEQRLLKVLMDNMPDRIYFKDLNSCFIDVNNAMIKKHGFNSIDDMIGKNDFELFSEEHAQKAYKDEQNIIKTGNPKEHIVEKETWQDGRITWASTTKMPLKDDKGRIIGTFGITRDITDERLSHLKLKYQALLLNEITDAMIAVDTDYRVTSWNKGAEKLYGRKADDVLGKEIIEVLPIKMSNEERIQLRREVIENGCWNGEAVHYDKDGNEIEVEWSINVVKDGENQIVGSVAIIRDISQRKQMQEAIRKSEARFRTLYENATIGIYHSTPDGKLEIANPAFINMLGYNSLEELSAIDIATEGYVDTTVRDTFKKILEDEDSIYGFENAWRKQNGGIIFLRESARLIRDENGNPLYYEGTIEDITEKKEAEEKIRKFNEELKQLNANKDKFFSIIAHDLRSPFTALLGYSDMIVQDFNELDADEIKEFATYINHEAKSVYGLLENLLTWSRLQRGGFPFEPEEFELISTVDKVIELFNDTAHSKNISLVSEVDKTTKVYADENIMFTVVRNLTSNAIKFTNEGGTIRITSTAKDDFVEMSVSDTGIGISDEDIQKLFKIDVHHTTIGTSEEKGTGLGLVLCKELVEKNGGTIQVKSKLDEGTTFCFTIPAINKNLK